MKLRLSRSATLSVWIAWHALATATLAFALWYRHQVGGAIDTQFKLSIVVILVMQVAVATAVTIAVRDKPVSPVAAFGWLMAAMAPCFVLLLLSEARYSRITLAFAIVFIGASAVASLMLNSMLRWRTIIALGVVLATGSAYTMRPPSRKAGVKNQPGAAAASFDWREYAGSAASSRYVPLTQIDKTNVASLAVAWSYPHGTTGFNPLIVRGTMYARGSNDAIVALNAATGEEIWVHDQIPGATARGLNYWESADSSDRRLFFSSGDYLQAIDATTGKSIRTFGTNGVVDLREGLGRDASTIGRIQSMTPGRVFENLIILGSSGGEPYFSPPGDVRAFDVVSGKLVWQFHTIPHPGEFGYDTWPKDAWKYAGGANVWGEITVDAQRAIAFVPTGSPTYDYYGADRVGANLYGTSLIALDARTGKRLWHFQNVHHDLWDFDNAAAPQLTTIERNGKPVDVVALAAKTGYLYVFERSTGKPVWPIEERSVSVRTDVPGERPWPTQPIPTKPPPFGRQRFTVDDINPYLLTPLEREQVRQRVMRARNDGPFTPIGFEEVVHMPGNHGGANWGSTSATPAGNVYVISFNVPAIMRLERPGAKRISGSGSASGQTVYQKNCQTCHGADLAGIAPAPSLRGVATRLNDRQLRDAILDGQSLMPGFHYLSDDEVEALIAYMKSASPGAAPAAPAHAPVVRPGPVAESGPATERKPSAAGKLMPGYPGGVAAPAARYVASGFGLSPRIIGAPYTTLTAYDLNSGDIRWQIPLGDDGTLLSLQVKGTGSLDFSVKGSVIPTASGLLFVNTADQKIRAYDADTGLELWSAPLGGRSSGSPSMYAVAGRQYLVVTAGDRITAWALPKQ